MCDAMHFAEELTGRCGREREPIAAQAISDASHITCVGNDYGYEEIFARSVKALGRQGDVLLVFSTSGNSANLLAAAAAAAAKGMKVVGFLGRDGGKLLALCDTSVVIPGQSASRIQELHIKLVHILIELIEDEIFPR